jgi:hypothetical protein
MLSNIKIYKMKKSILIVALVFSGFVFGTASAQINVSVRANIGVQPLWGPVGYDHVEYYYMPDIHVFYYVPGRQYIYRQRGRWVHANALPYQYRNYNVYNGYKVVVNDRTPYRNAEAYRAKYAEYKGNHDQGNIRNSRDSRYYEIKGHPEHDNWKRGRTQQNNDNNHRKDDNRHNK